MMDALDRALLNIIQTDFPITSRPYATLAQLVGSSEYEAWSRILSLRQKGIIRRLGGVFDSHRLGYKSTLCAAKVPEDKIQVLADLLMDLPGVTHNYLRNHAYNMWFTLIAPSQTEVEKTLTKIRETVGTTEVYSLPALRLFKISVDFNFNSSEHNPTDHNSSGHNSPGHISSVAELRLHGPEHKGHRFKTSKPANLWSKPQPYPVDEEDKALVRELQGNIPESLAPFAEIGEKLGWEEEKVIIKTQNLRTHKVIRRFGAVLRHQKAGFTANAMGVWQVPEDKIEEVGRILASFREVSHCYQRPTLPDWPYNLFTMIHGRSHEECAEIMERMSQVTGIKDYSMLFSLKELKKSSMLYYV